MLDIEYDYEFNFLADISDEFIIRRHPMSIETLIDRISKSNAVSSAHVKQPLTLQEKLRWLSCNNTDAYKTYCADKITLRTYAHNRLHKDICPNILKVYESENDIKLEELPNEFMLKCNHGSGMNIPCYDKRTFNMQSAREKIHTWIHTITGVNSDEYHYAFIPRKIFAEELLSTSSLIDYRLWCFNGHPEFIGISAGFGHGAITYYDMNFKQIPMQNNNYRSTFCKPYDKPSSFSIMQEYASILSKDHKFVRVDFYEINGSPILSELTFTPGGFLFSFGEKYDRYYGEKLCIL